MVIAVNTILQWCGAAPAASRTAVTAALMPGGMSELADFSVDEIKEAAKSFARLPVGPFFNTIQFQFTTHSVRHSKITGRLTITY
jgi:hypothetical protein